MPTLEHNDNGKRGMKTVVISNFSGGMVGDLHDTRPNVCRTCQHFDVFTNPHSLIPHYTAEVGDASANTQKIKNYAFDGTTLFGYGLETSAGTNSYIYSRTTFTGSTWTAVKNVQREQGDAYYPFFTYYRKVGKLFGVGGGRYIWSYAPGTDTLANEAQDLGAASYTTVSNGVVHSKDDCLYFGYNNKIAKNNNDTWTPVALTLPSQYVITSICEYGDFLAIACRHQGTGNSRVFLWDRDETTTTLSGSVDWEQGDIYSLEELEGYLVGVSFEGFTGTANVGQSRTVFRHFSGTGGAVQFAEFTGFGQTPTIQASLYKGKARHRILFPAVINIGGAAGNQVAGKKGIWAITKTSSGFAVVQEYSYLNNTPDNGTMYGILQIGDILFASYTDNSTHYTDKTDDAVVYTQTSVYETVANPEMEAADRIRLKNLHAIAVTARRLVSGEQIVVKYKVDGGTFSSAVITKTSSSPDTDLIAYEAIVNVAGTAKKGREFEFRIESTGGAEVTSLAYQFEVLSSLI